jgi:small nuclear ribonucleoprotein (snRNP)-like protein
MSQQPLHPAVAQTTPKAAARNNNNTAAAPTQLHPSSSIPHGHVPAYLPGSASLVEELDQQLLIVLRDGKHIVGVSMRNERNVGPTNRSRACTCMEDKRSIDQPCSAIQLVLCSNLTLYGFLTYLLTHAQTLVSFDQFSNLVLKDAVERRLLLSSSNDITATNTQASPRYYYTDISLGGIYCVRGENMVLLGRHQESSGGNGERLEWKDWQTKYNELHPPGKPTPATEWDFDSDLIA